MEYLTPDATQRRRVLKGGLTLALGFLSGCQLGGGRTRSSRLLGFTAVPAGKANGRIPVISADYEYQVLIPWGEPLQPGGPAFQRPPDATAQEQQIGIGHDGMTYFPVNGASDRGLLALNHEYGKNPHVLGVPLPTSIDMVRASQHAHGVSIVELGSINGKWQPIASPYARRIHANSPVSFSGPVAGHTLLKNPADNPYQGTFANCSNGQTPWGTYLTCEENFNLYFGASTPFEPTRVQQRYGLSGVDAGYGWHRFDPRFNLGNPDYVNEANRYGWVVEIDPRNRNQIPVKRTALGRFKHEGAATTIGKNGRVVVYMGDDQRFEFIYKFVSSGDWQALRAAGHSPLDEGDLYVARFDADGSGSWLHLSVDNPVLSEHFSDQAALLVNTRQAASLLGATAMDRPEWTTVAADGHVYCSLTNNSARQQPDAANPLAPNMNGHIIRFIDQDNHVGTRFTWEIFLLAEDHLNTEHSFGSPDGLWADPDGRLFIETDGAQKFGLPNQLLIADTVSGEIKRLLIGVAGCEITGLTTTPDRRTLFVNVHLPGNGDPALTNFPAAYDGITVPRDATLAIRRRDGGIVGS
jgi:secreted PhoX family phosphatase